MSASRVCVLPKPNRNDRPTAKGLEVSGTPHERRLSRAHYSFTYLPEARPVIRALLRLGQTFDAAQLSGSDDAQEQRWVLCTFVKSAGDIERLATALEYALKSDLPALELSRKVLIRRTESGLMLAFRSIVGVPVRILGP